MLDLIGRALRQISAKFVRIDGKMTNADRCKVIENFRNDDSCTILLATLGSGGVGLVSPKSRMLGLCLAA
jgi:SNF2 family DNA or RNA helicase